MPDIYATRQQLPITLTAEKENELFMVVMEEGAEDIESFIQEILDYGLFSGEKLEGKERLLHYTLFTDQRDFAYIMDEDYIKKWKAGLYPNLVSPRWLAAASLPKVFDYMAKDFRSVYKRYVENAQ